MVEYYLRFADELEACDVLSAFRIREAQAVLESRLLEATNSEEAEQIIDEYFRGIEWSFAGLFHAINPFGIVRIVDAEGNVELLDERFHVNLILNSETLPEEYIPYVVNPEAPVCTWA